MKPKDYQRYLASAHWQNTRTRKLAAAGRRCEFCPIVMEHPKHGPLRDHKLRCTEITRLEVHHKHYDSIGRETNDDLEVLCKFHHLVSHVMNSGCDICDEATVTDEDDAIDLVRNAVDDYGGIDAVTLDAIDAPSWCDYHEHMLTKND